MPGIGQIVIYRCADDEIRFHGSQPHPAIVTWCHSDEVINLKVFYDCGGIRNQTSVVHGKGPGQWDYD